MHEKPVPLLDLPDFPCIIIVRKIANLRNRFAKSL